MTEATPQSTIDFRDQARCRRIAKRVRCRLPATIKSSKQVVADGVIENMSATGLCVSVGRIRGSPGHVEVSSFALDKQRVARVIWVNAGRIGLEFVDAAGDHQLCDV